MLMITGLWSLPPSCDDTSHSAMARSGVLVVLQSLSRRTLYHKAQEAVAETTLAQSPSLLSCPLPFDYADHGCRSSHTYNTATGLPT